MREVVLDTETTGLDPATGDRIVEIGCVALMNHIATGETFHRYLNPQRDMPEGAFRVHGLSTQFLSDKPLFVAVADEFLAFIADATLVIHNAEFDLKFINAELRRIGKPDLSAMKVVDTLHIARRKHPGVSNTLDALCARYGIDNARRAKHGALLDSEILADVYIELLGGRQRTLGFSVASSPAALTRKAKPTKRAAPLPCRIMPEDDQRHRAFVAGLGEKAIWRDYATYGDDAG